MRKIKIQKINSTLKHNSNSNSTNDNWTSSLGFNFGGGVGTTDVPGGSLCGSITGSLGDSFSFSPGGVGFGLDISSWGLQLSRADSFGSMSLPSSLLASLMASPEPSRAPSPVPAGARGQGLGQGLGQPGRRVSGDAPAPWRLCHG